MDAKVARHLNAEHRARCAVVNASRKHNPIYVLGSKVWFGRPASLSSGLYSVWEGPGVVLRRVGEERERIRLFRTIRSNHM